MFPPSLRSNSVCMRLTFATVLLDHGESVRICLASCWVQLGTGLSFHDEGSAAISTTAITGNTQSCELLNTLPPVLLTDRRRRAWPHLRLGQFLYIQFAALVFVQSVEFRRHEGQ